MLTFANPGLIDVRAITTFGLNAKATTSPIGHFGTGLKYATAVICRLGGTLSITCHEKLGKVTHTFASVPTEVRGKTFNLVSMTTIYPDGTAETIPLAFTTDLGKDWKPWMAYRELRSNMMDEGGDFGAEFPLPYTHITLNCPEVEAVHAYAGDFFLETKPLWTSPDLEIHPKRRDGAIFYRGIRVATLSAPLLYSYNILHEAPLTEDRTLDTWHCKYRIQKALANLGDKEMAEAILLAPEPFFEETFAFDYADTFTPVMLEAIKLNRHNKKLNRSAHRRAKALFAEDFLPEALPMTKAQRDKIAAAHKTMAHFNLPSDWDEVRLMKTEDPESGQEETKVTDLADGDKILWMTQEAFDGPDFFPHLLRAHWEAEAYDGYEVLRKERLIAKLMQWD